MVFICHQNEVYKKNIGCVYFGMSESGPCIFRQLCPVGFLVASKGLSVLLQSVVMSYVDYSDDG